MKFLIVLALAAVANASPQYFNSFAIPTVLPDGHLADTPEVAAAKIAHYSAHATKSLAGASIAVAAAPVPVAAAPVVSHYAAPAAAIASPYYKSFYSGPLAIPTILPSGHLADTPEVAAAKIAHFSEHARALAKSAPAAFAGPAISHFAALAAPIASPYYKSFYAGPLAVPTVLPSGHLADTPEVAAAKAFHFAEHAKALSLSAF